MRQNRQQYIHRARSNKQKKQVPRRSIYLRLLQPGWVMMALSALAGAQADEPRKIAEGHPNAPKMDRWNICGVQNHIVGTHTAKNDCSLHLISN